MKNNIYYFILISFILFFNIARLSADELVIKALKIDIKEEGNILIASGEAEAISNNEIEIYANNFKYNKKKGLLVASGNVKVLDLLNKIILNSENIHYNENDQTLISYGNTKININDKYNIITKNLNYSYKEKEISSDFLTYITDNSQNNIELEQFKYFFIEEIIRGKKIKLVDTQGDSYFLQDGMIELKNNLLSGKDIEVKFDNLNFDTPKSDPRLKGNSVFYGNQNTIIQKGVFTSCKQTDSCPPWLITSKEITHDKKKKQIKYKNAWLKIYDIPVLYFPKFFHPDPSVKRQSGFLKPKFGDSRRLGASINIPYYYVISNSSDLTFKPRVFSPTEFLVGSEYRKVTKNSSSIVDFSFNKNENDSKNGRQTHFFINSLIDLRLSSFDTSSLDLKFEKTSNDNYLKTYSLNDNRSIVNNTEILESDLSFSGTKNDFFIDLSFESYETMGLSNNNRYEFVYPNYSLYKNIDLTNTFFESLDVSSYGNQRTHTTNIYEAVQVNDLLLSSKKFINRKGFENNFKALFKNVNSEGENSPKFKKDIQSEVLNIISYDLSLPLKKSGELFFDYLTPKISLRHSPNDTNNIKNNDHYLSKSNIFNLNRIGTNESIEGGSSITYGFEYERQNLEFDKIFNFSAASVIRSQKNENLPLKSTLGQKQSDIVGNIYYSPISNIDFNYDYSLNKNTETVNLHSLTNKIKANNFVHTFNFYEENNIIGKNSYFSNKLKYMANDKSSFSFETRKNKENDLTEFYNLIYQYQNDCLTASIQYNKEYYNSNVIKPYEQLFFNITLIPLGGTSTENLLPQ